MSLADLKYQIDESDDNLDVFATLDGTCVGKALCLKDGKTLKLADIEVAVHLRNRGVGG